MQASFAEIPHPNWQPGQKQPVPYEGDYISLDPLKLGPSGSYPLVISTVVPRPIGFLSTISAEGKVNLSPYSYFGAMGHDPPLVRRCHIQDCACALLLLFRGVQEHVIPMAIQSVPANSHAKCAMQCLHEYRASAATERKQLQSKHVNVAIAT